MSEPAWDKYFYTLTFSVALNSKCLSRKIGAIIVRDHSIISTGYNGPARGVRSCLERTGNNTCPRHLMGYNSGEGLEHCPAAHAEVNAITNAARLGVSVLGASIYLSCEIPCKDCLSHIINSGIVEVVAIRLNYYDCLSKLISSESNLIIRTYDPI